tara:strand:- start:14 stop:883 length:870 start_codon:yes stop_codon:yes gene_type:complete
MFNSGLLKGTTIRMADGTKKNVEDIEVGDIVETYNLLDNAHLRFNEVIAGEVYSITSRIENKLVTTTFDNGNSLTTTLEYPYKMQHTSGSMCADSETFGICEHAGWESYRPDITAEYYWDPHPWPSNDSRFNIPESSKYNSNLPPLTVGDEIWADAGKHPPTHISNETIDPWWNEWEEPEFRITEFNEITGPFEVYILEVLDKGGTVWANDVLVAAGQSYKYNSEGRGPGYLPSENINNVKIREDLVNTKHIVEIDLRDRQLELYSQVTTWPGDKGDIIEYYEKHGTLE